MSVGRQTEFVKDCFKFACLPWKKKGKEKKKHMFSFLDKEKQINKMNAETEKECPV
jgi:hypothetical protein